MELLNGLGWIMNKIVIAIIFVSTLLIAGYPKYKSYRKKHNIEEARKVLQEQGLAKINYNDLVDKSYKKQITNNNGYPMNVTTIKVLGWEKSKFERVYDEQLIYEYADQIRFSVCQDVANYFSKKYEEKKITRQTLKTYGKLFRDDKVAIHLVLEDRKGKEVLTSTIYFSECSALQVLIFGR